MAMSYKRVGTQKGFHHVRVEAAAEDDCECGDHMGVIDAGTSTVQRWVCRDEQLDEFLQVTLTLTSTAVVVIMAAVVSAEQTVRH